MSKYQMTAACGKRYIKWLGDRAEATWMSPSFEDIMGFLASEGFDSRRVTTVSELAQEVQGDTHALFTLINAMGYALAKDRQFISKTEEFFRAAVSRFGVDEWDVHMYDDKTGDRTGTLGGYLAVRDKKEAAT